MFPIEDFFAFTLTQLFAEYMQYNLMKSKELYGDEQGEINDGSYARAVNMLNDEVTPNTAQEACYVMDEYIQDTDNGDVQYEKFIEHFLPFFNNLGEALDEEERNFVFMKYKGQVVTCDDIDEAYLYSFNNPAVKFAAEMGIDMYYNNFGKNEIINNKKYDLGQDLMNAISFSDNTELYTKAIFQAARQNEKYLIPTLVNIVFHAYETVKEIRSNEMHDDEEEDYVYEPLFPPHFEEEEEEGEPENEEANEQEVREEYEQLMWKKQRYQEEIDSDVEDLVM